MKTFTAENPRALERRVKQHLGEVRPEFSRLQVYASGTTIRIIGVVGSFYLRQVAINSAKRVDGVAVVEDDIEVAIKDESGSQ